MGPIWYLLGAWRPENGPKMGGSGPAPNGGGGRVPRRGGGGPGASGGVGEGFGGAFLGGAQLPVNKFTFTQFWQEIPGLGVL